jgi:hypothetical protein
MNLNEQLARWVAGGLISEAQAGQITAAEAARAPAAATRRAPLAVEALGYAGGVLAIVAGFAAVPDLWPGIPAAAELAFAGVAAAALAAGGALVRTGDDPAFGRLRSVLWLLSTASLAAFAALLAGRIWQVSPASTTLVAAATATGYAAVLWLRSATVLQHLGLFAAAAALAGAAVDRADPGLGAWGPGLAVWVLSAGWGIAVLRGYLRPVPAGYLAAGAGLLTGAQLTMDVAAGHILALVTMAGLLAAGVALRRAGLVGLGAFGVLVMVPQTAARYLPASAAAPLAIFVVGLVLLGSALWLATRWRPRAR